MFENSSNFPYLPHTDKERQEMLKTIGEDSFNELIEHVPTEIRANQLDLPSGMSELELSQYISSLAAKNKPASAQSSFLGGGSYHRFVPSVVSSVVSRSEFATAYTPYQPEVSQGSLQVIYEFQTAVCLLTGMEVANASMYDGPTACAEAALMASRLTGRSNIVVCESVNPEHRLVTKTLSESCGLTVSLLKAHSGAVELTELTLDNQTAAVIVQYPNYFGCFEDLFALEKAVHKQGALLVVVTEPVSLGLLAPPSQFNADIVVGDAQPCGNFLSFGGPSAGYMATRKDFVRQLPGRLAGMTVDNRGQRAFTLTLQTREQHIRRAKATSNICTNQALNALAMLVYLSVMGPQGLRQLAEVGVQRAHVLAEGLTSVAGVTMAFDRPFFTEFVIATSLPAATVLRQLQDEGILGGLDLGRINADFKDRILVAVTEMNSPAELDRYIEVLSKILAKTNTASGMLTKTKV